MSNKIFCFTCKKFISKCNYSKHLKTDKHKNGNSSKIYTCKDCDNYSTENYNTFKSHRQRHHSGKNRMVTYKWFCTICTQKLKDNQAKNKHIMSKKHINKLIETYNITYDIAINYIRDNSTCSEIIEDKKRIEIRTHRGVYNKFSYNYQNYTSDKNINFDSINMDDVILYLRNYVITNHIDCDAFDYEWYTSNELCNDDKQEFIINLADSIEVHNENKNTNKE